MSLKSSFVQFLNSKYPSLSVAALNNLISDQLLSPFHVQLPSSALQKLQTEIQGYQTLQQWTAANLADEYKKKNLLQPKNSAVCTSYDFHIDADGNPKLIEINTNAAFLALGVELYEFHQHTPETGFNTKKMLQMFQKDVGLSGANPEAICIMDEKPNEQRLYVEFLIFQKIFEQNGLQSKILDISDIGAVAKNSFIYNRYTDFYLSEEKSNLIRDRFNKSEIHLSPHPYEYFLCADKQRLHDWNEQTAVAKPESLLKIYDLGKEDREFIWSQRKHLFFKPKNSFGSKQAYKGHNISRRNFDEFYGDQFIAQELAPPAEIDVVIDGQTQKMKYDLRCYAYQGELQLIIARLYQGQTTNLRTVGGGFAIVKFTS